MRLEEGTAAVAKTGPLFTTFREVIIGERAGTLTCGLTMSAAGTAGKKS